MQLILQDPTGSLNPRHTVYEAVAEGLRVHRVAGDEQAAVAGGLSRAGLRPAERYFLRYPHELSGGQRQRVVIAGALVLDPEVLVADEPVSSLDASVRGEILALLLALRHELGLSVLVVTHDLGLAWNIADRIAVMYLGRIVECGPTEEVLADPQAPVHPGAALRRAGDQAPGGPIVLAASRPTRPGCPAAAASTHAAPRCVRCGGEAGLARCVRAGACCRGEASGGCLPVLPAAADGHAADLLPSTWRRRDVRPLEADGSLQAALPARFYVDEGHWRPGTGAGAARRVVLRRPAVPDLGDGPSGWPCSTSPGRACWSPGTPRAPCARSSTSAATAGRRSCPSTRTPRRRRPATSASLRCPYHSWTYDLDGRLLRAPHTEDVEDFAPG